MSRTRASDVLALLRAARIVFWDFDGVIKDSVEIKTDAFGELFAAFGAEVAQRVREHHAAHGGVSRYEKMPIYLGWAGLPADAVSVQDYCDRFSKLVLRAVIEAPWVPGVCEYLLMQRASQHFVLVTATPQEEIEEIVEAIGLNGCFREIYGAPTQKSIAVGLVLRRTGYTAESCALVGDAPTDLAAARSHGVPFVLRRTPLNRELQGNDVHMFDELR